MPYTYATLDDLLLTLGSRLGDPQHVFWTEAELTIYINDALRTWNSISRMFRDRGFFTTTSTDTFFDLTQVLSNGSEFILSRNVTEAQQVEQLKYMLMEPAPADQVTFTNQYVLEDLTNALIGSRNQFLLETGIAITLTADQVVGAGDGRIVIADQNVIDIVRASWTDQDGVVTALMREDGYASASFSPSWRQSPGTPARYSIYPDPLLTIQLIPPPDNTGTLSLQTISVGSLPDDFTPFILWGALAELLSKAGLPHDPARARYALQRHNEGVEAAKQVVSVMQSYVNDQPVQTGSVFAQDRFDPSWAYVRSAPNNVGMLGHNIVSLSPAPDGVYSVMMDVARNAPIMVNGTDNIPLGKEYLDLLEGYVVHLAHFKQGAAEISSSQSFYEDFINAAIDYNNRMQGRNLFFETLTNRAAKEGQEQPLRYETAQSR